MRLDFLSAADSTRLSKKYYKDATGTIHSVPYPFVKDFTSHTHNGINTIEMLYATLRMEAEEGRCLLKGTLARPLNAESRAGHTRAETPTGYIVLDLDLFEGFDTIDEVLMAIDPALSTVSYVMQHSSSSGITGSAGLRGHVFMMLEKEQSPLILKQWLIAKNVTEGPLAKHLQLGKNGLALKYPLDVTTCQNDKLIYIAPPTCEGLEDPFKDNRFQLVRRENSRLSGNFFANAAENQALVDKHIVRLRKEMGLPARKPKYRAFGDSQLLLNPDQCTITGIKQAREFTYLNLNGGDSWGYFFPTDCPDIIYNFKGEPLVRLEDISPDMYASLKAPKERAVENADRVPIVFRDRSADTYYNGFYSLTTNELDVTPASSTQRLSHFLQQHGVAPPEFIEDWTYEFNPSTTTVIDVDARWVNKFQPTEYMLDATTKSAGVPNTIYRVIRSICGDDKTTYEHFLNWLAYVFQTRDKTGTAWCFHGVPGTGKGILAERILQPLFGHRHVLEFTTQSMEDKFNSGIETALFVILDEFRTEDAAQATMLTNKLKNLITENYVIIRPMRQNPRQCRVYNNVILNTNDADPLPLDPNDRRWNIAPAQETPLIISDEEIAAISAELPLFAAYLRDYIVDQPRVRKVLRNDARSKMIEAGETAKDSFFRAIREGDLDFFLQWMRKQAPLTPGNSYLEFRDAVYRWKSAGNHPVRVKRNELEAAYNYILNAKVAPMKFARMCSMQRITMEPYRIDGEVVRCHEVLFKSTAPNDTLPELAPTNHKVVNING